MKRAKLAALLALAFILGSAAWLAAAQTSEEAATSATPPAALWGKNGLEICNTPGNTIQQNPQLRPASDGNLLLAWEDGRFGYTAIYVEKLSPAGEKLWAEASVSLGRNGNQNSPQLIDDGLGGLIVTWQEYRSGNADIFAQRFNSRGTPLWGENGLVVCKAAAGQFAPNLASDGAGGAIITWHDYRSGSGEDIYAQRVNASGLPLWLSDGLPVCTAAGTQWYPKIASDGAGGAIIVWADGRNSAADNNIYGQRLDGNGQALWEKEGIPLCAAAQNQERPLILPVDKGFILAWHDSRNGNVDIYAQKIDLAGAPLWDEDGVAVTIAPFNQNDPRLADDGNGGAVVAWSDGREEETVIYTQRVSNTGKTEWEENGRRLAQATGRQEHAEIVKLKTSDWVVVWEDSRKGYPLLFTQKINNSGLPLWSEAGNLVAGSNRPQEKPVLAVTTAGELALAWQDKRSGNYDIFGQRLTVNDGLRSWGEKGLGLAAAPGLVLHQNASLVNASGGNLILVFEDARSGYLNIYAQKIDREGTLFWGKNALPVAKVQADQLNPQAVSDGSGGVIVAWEDSRNPQGTQIYAQHIGSDGRKLFAGGSLPLTEIKSRQEKPVIASDGGGGAIVIWEDERNTLSLKDLYGQRLSGSGDLLWGKNGAAACGENGDQIEANMIIDGRKGIILTWSDYRRGERNPDIYALRLDGSGKALWNKEGVMVCGAPDIQRNPKISSDGAGGAVIVWTDKGGGSYDIYTQRLDAAGKTLWLTDGIPINQAPRTQQNPQLCDNSILVWEDYRYGNWDIFAAAISAQGKLTWGEDGMPVASLPLTQYAPQAICWKDGGIIVTWEDYRNGRQYEIFYQGLTGRGQPRWIANGLQVKTTNGARAPKILGQPGSSSFIIIWEDYTGGGKALFGQRFSLD
ncbi:MAG: hypothetical protein WC632_07340 [Candidatus Margulisiibacteriota bacterium]